MRLIFKIMLHVSKRLPHQQFSLYLGLTHHLQLARKVSRRTLGISTHNGDRPIAIKNFVAYF